jgi:hypothetical protein
MDKHENRDDLIKRVIEQTAKNEKRHVDSKEREKIAKMVIKDIMPKIYEK